MNTPHLPEPVSPPPAEFSAAAVTSATPGSLKIVVNGRTVVQRHFLQQTMDAMVRRALADEPVLGTG